MAANKKFPKRTIKVRQANLPAGEKNVTFNLETLVTDMRESIASGMASFYIGNGMLGKDPRTFIAAAKKNHQSILGDSNSIFSLLAQIKTNIMAAKFADTMQTINTAMKTYLDNDETVSLQRLSIIEDLTTISDTLESIKSFLNDFDTESSVSKNKIELLIKGLKEDALKSLIEISERDIDPSSKNSRALSNFLTMIGKFSTIKPESLQGIDNVEKSIVPLTRLFKNIETLSKKGGDLESINQFSSKIKNIMSGLMSIQGLEEDKSKNILSSIRNINKVLEEMSIANENLKGKDFDSYILGLTDIFDKASTLDRLFANLDSMSPTNPEQLSIIHDDIVQISNILYRLNNLNVKDMEFTSDLEWIQSVLSGGDGTLESIFKDVNRIADISNNQKFERIVSNIMSVENIINTLAKIKIDKNIPDVITELANLFSTKTSDTIKSLSTIFNAINSIQTPNQKKFEQTISGLEGVASIIETLNRINVKGQDISKMRVNILDYIDVLEEIYDEIKEKYDKIIKIADLSDQIKVANKKIEESLDSCNEVAVKTSKKNEDIKKASISMNGLASFMIAAAAVMSIGALFMMAGGAKFAKNALLFGVTLMIFEALVVAPLLLFNTQEGKVYPALNNLNSFVVTCTATMLVGALFMTFGGGKFMKAALGFAITLGLFEALIVAPIMTFKYIAKDSIESLEGFSSFIITCTTILSIGALFMAIGGGKLVKNAILFGLTLALFETLTVTPFILFSKLSGQINKGLQQFSGFIVTTTTIMLIGSLFMALSNGKLVKNALKFAFTLAVFETMVVLPFILFNGMKDQAFNGMKLFTTMVVTSTIILMIGALFMNAKGGKYAKEALKFTGLLMLFEVGVLLPLFLLNKLKNQVFRGLVDFTAMIIVCTTALLIGSMFMTMKGGQMPAAALEFTKILTLFETAIVIPLLLFSKVSDVAMKSAKDLGLFVALCTASLIGGAAYINTYGSKSVIEFGIILGVFVGAMEAIAAGLSIWLNGKTIMKMKELSLFIGASTAALLIGSMFVKTYGIESVTSYAAVLGLFVAAMGGIIIVLTKFMGPMTLPAMMEFGAFVALSSASLVIGSLYIEKYGEASALKYTGVLSLYIVAMGLVMAGLGFMTPYLTPGIAAATGLGIAVSTLSLSMMLVNFIFEQDKGGKKIMKNIETLINVIGKVWLPFSLLSLATVPIVYGTIAATALGVGLITLSGSLNIMDSFIADKGDSIKDSIIDMYAIVGMISALALEIGLLGVPIGVATALGIVPLNLFVGGLTLAVSNLTSSVSKMNSVGDISQQTALIAKNINSFLGIIDDIDLGGWGFFKRLVVINSLGDLVRPLGKNMILVATAVQDLANLKVATRWDKDGKPIGYRQLNDNDFGIAQRNVGKLIYTLADAFVMTWYGGTDKEGNSYRGLRQLVENDDDALWQTLYFSGKIGQVISNIADGVGNMAKMQIPIAWDSKGKAIGYRQLKQRDFQLAADGVETILTNMVRIISGIYEKGNPGGEYHDGVTEGNIFDMISGGIFSSDKPSPFINTLESTLRIGEVISNIGGAVGNMAKMQIPIDWDTNGKVIGYRTLKTRDFIDAGNSMEKILTSLIKELGSLYAKGRTPEFGGSGGQNIFDVISGDILESDKPSPLSTVLESSLKISEVISNIGSGVKNIATLQIPNEWDPKTGKATSYVTLTPNDFSNAASSISEILTTVTLAVANLNIDTDSVEEKIQSILPISELIGNMSEGIVKLASGQVPDEWDKKTGKAIHFTKITKQDYIDAGAAIEKILIGQVNAITKVAKDHPEYFGEENQLFTDIVTSISSTGNLISNIADSIIKIGQGMVPDEKGGWENGKPKKYKRIDYTQAVLDLEDALDTILPAMANAIIKCYNGDGKNYQGLKKILGDNPDDNSPFNVAVRCIGEITKITSGVVDTMIKIASGQIPDFNGGWENGKPKKYKHINPNDVIKDINNLFFGNNEHKEGILTILANVVSQTYDEYFAPGKKFDPSAPISVLSITSEGISNILKIISKSTDTIVKIASSNIPVSWDSDGNANKYVRLDQKEILRAKTIISDIIGGLLGLFDSDMIQTYQDENQRQTLELVSDNINNIIAAIGGTILTTLNQVKEINKYKEEIENFGTLDFSKIFNNLMKTTSDLQLLCSSFTYDPTEKSIFDFLTDELSNYIYNGIIPFDKAAYESSTLLCKSINETNKTMNDAKGSQTFKNNREELQKYIKTINTVDLTRLNTMNSLVSNLNEIAKKWPDLDKLTTAVVDKLTPVLSALVRRLEESANTINKADEIQTRRHKKIQEAINTVQNLMANPLQVVVSSETTENMDDGQTTTTRDDNSNSGGSRGPRNTTYGGDETTQRRGNQRGQTTGAPRKKDNSIQT